ncbi:MAG: hypothetical protein GY702_23465 [Desulfobulbaceae bacterium]|nr:hypothetical protein [Desulfobulbaceae bacterium]
MKRAVHIALCRQALDKWQGYCESVADLSYVEAICGTKQVVDPHLPSDALNAVIACRASDDVSTRYHEPIAALQDDDLELPDDTEFAFYVIYNLHQRYIVGRLLLFMINEWFLMFGIKPECHIQ